MLWSQEHPKDLSTFLKAVLNTRCLIEKTGFVGLEQQVPALSYCRNTKCDLRLQQVSLALLFALERDLNPAQSVSIMWVEAQSQTCPVGWSMAPSTLIPTGMVNVEEFEPNVAAWKALV